MCLLRSGKFRSGRKPPALSLLFLLGKIIEEDNNRMSKIAIVTDSNSGISQKEAKEMGIFVLPMPFLINGKEYLDGVDLLPEQFYEFLKEDADVATSQPSPDSVMKLWEKVLKEYDEIVHIPMSSGLSGSCQTAMMLADDYDGKVQINSIK